MRTIKVALLLGSLAFASIARAQVLPQPIVGRPAALIANGGFDAAEGSQPLGWTVEGNTANVRIVNRKDDRTSGLASLEMTADGASPIAVRSRRAIGVPGGSYTLTAKTKSKIGTPATIAIEFWSFENKRLGEAHVATRQTPQTSPATTRSSGEWQTVTLDAVAPDGTAHVAVVIAAPRDARGVSIWDDVALTLTPEPYDPTLGAGRELFLDDYRIESAAHVARVVHPATTTTRPVLRADKPWEGSAYIYGSVFKIGGAYRMWYTAYADVAPNYFNAYAESNDGVTWTKPELGLVDYNGSKANNLVGMNGTVAYNPDAAPDRRYVSLGFKGGVPNETLGYYVSFSPDGLRWTPASDKPALFDGDVSNLSFDPVGKRYIATIKKRMFTARTPGIYERSAFVSTSADAMTWTPPRLAVMGDYADDGHAESIGGLEAQIYGMPVSRYESTYVGFPWVLSILNYTAGESAGAGDGPVEVQIASSRDLTRWSRPIRTRVIDPGAAGAWNAGATYTAANLLVDDSTITMYYGAFNLEHGGSDLNDSNRGRNVAHIGIATWRRDGWVSLSNAAGDGVGNAGEVTTKPLTLDGATLHVNASIHPSGSLKIDVLHADGKPIDGYSASIEGDALDRSVTWSNGKTLVDLDAKPVKLRFTLADVDLYSYWVTK